MIALQRIEVEGKRFVLLPETEYDRLCRGAGEAVATGEDELPPLPKPDKHGRFPALEYARISLARDLIRDRKGVGLSQQRLGRPGGRSAGNPIEDRNRQAHGQPQNRRQNHGGNRGPAATAARRKARE